MVLYVCKTGFLTLKEEYRPRVFKKWVLRIFGEKGVEVTGDLRKLHDEELNNL
jgi:hypothetical protein